MDTTNLTSTQRWLVRETWPYLESITSKKGFGDFADMKKSIGMPTATRNDHHDWEVSTETKQTIELPDSPHGLTLIFYEHLFSNNPEMTEIFWRFNLFQSLEKIVAVLNPQIDLTSSLQALAERHRGRGILNVDYDKIKVSLQFALLQLPRSKLSQLAVEAWVSAWTLFANAMKVDDKFPTLGPTFPTLGPSHGLPAKHGENKPIKYNIEEVRKHASAEDLWLVINGNVYDMTKYLKYHPGKDRMLEGAGQDATKIFMDNFHSKRARTILGKYYIGELVE
eukprot:Phypoly_transcript_11115.p1 GENE.Phypoly_transcript_11115~~Phypoly_transcript_11115.p1  ORF type:complete len:280 (+),score=22.77 Phypoly_transcript_11115:146-985(+)